MPNYGKLQRIPQLSMLRPVATPAVTPTCAFSDPSLRDPALISGVTRGVLRS